MVQAIRYLIRGISMEIKEKQRLMFGNQFLNLGATSQGDARVEATFAV